MKAISGIIYTKTIVTKTFTALVISTFVLKLGDSSESVTFLCCCHVSHQLWVYEGWMFLRIRIWTSVSHVDVIQYTKTCLFFTQQRDESAQRCEASLGEAFVIKIKQTQKHITYQTYPKTSSLLMFVCVLLFWTC